MVDAICEAAAAIGRADQVVSRCGKCAEDIRRCIGRVAGDNAVADLAIAVNTPSTRVAAVAGDRGAINRQCAQTEDAAAAAERTVAVDDVVGDG